MLLSKYKDLSMKSISLHRALCAVRTLPGDVETMILSVGSHWLCTLPCMPAHHQTRPAGDGLLHVYRPMGTTERTLLLVAQPTTCRFGRFVSHRISPVYRSRATGNVAATHDRPPPFRSKSTTGPVHRLLPTRKQSGFVGLGRIPVLAGQHALTARSSVR